MAEHPRGKVEELALCVAMGTSSVRAWSDAHSVPLRTCYSWLSKPPVKTRIARHRRELVDRAIGRLSSVSEAAVGCLAQIIAPKSEASDATKIQAARAILSHCVELSTYAELEARIAAMETAFAEPAPALRPIQNGRRK